MLLISIDEHEIKNILSLCNEIFGEHNFIENFIWIKNSTKNLSKTTSTNHEYVVCYAKDRSVVEDDEIFRIEKPGLDEVKKILENANKENLSIEEVENRLKQFYKSNPELKGISMYDKVEKRLDETSGQMRLKAYTLDNASAPKATGSGARYEVLHPVTHRPCISPTRGWAYTRETMDKHIAAGLIYFYEDENHVPRFKRFLDTVTTEVIKSAFDDFTDGKKELMRLFDGKAYFENAKPTTLINRFLKIIGKDDIVLDFFSGSATTAHAVMELNAEDGGNRKFIMVQVPEKCDEKSEVYKAGYKNICAIGEERIRRAGKKIKEEKGDNAKDLDIGFRVYKIDSTNMKDVYYKPTELSKNKLTDLISNIKEDRTAEDLLTQVILDLGLTLDLKVEKKKIGENKVYFVDKNSLVCCFDDNIDFNIIKEIAKEKPLKVVFKDSSFKSDSDKINLENEFKSLSSDTEISIL